VSHPRSRGRTDVAVENRGGVHVFRSATALGRAWLEASLAAAGQAPGDKLVIADKRQWLAVVEALAARQACSLGEPVETAAECAPRDSWAGDGSGV
jgi:hypothetical protein